MGQRIRLKRGTRASVNAYAALAQFQQAEPVYLTDEEQFGVAVNASTYRTVPGIVKLTQVQYDALSPPNPNILYVIVN